MMLPPVNNDEKNYFHNIFHSRVLFFYQTYVCTGVIEHVLNCWRLWFIYKRPIPKNIWTTNQNVFTCNEALLHGWKSAQNLFMNTFFKFSFEIWNFCFCVTNGLESSWKDQIYLVPNGPWSIFVIHVWNADLRQANAEYSNMTWQW